MTCIYACDNIVECRCQHGSSARIVWTARRPRLIKYLSTLHNITVQMYKSYFWPVCLSICTCAVYLKKFWFDLDFTRHFGIACRYRLGLYRSLPELIDFGTFGHLGPREVPPIVPEFDGNNVTAELPNLAQYISGQWRGVRGQTYATTQALWPRVQIFLCPRYVPKLFDPGQ